MGKETRISIGVISVLVVISSALLYGRLTADNGLPLNVDHGPLSTQNEVPKRRTIEQSPAAAYQAMRPVSPAPLRDTPTKTTGRSYLLDTDHSPVPTLTGDLAIPDYRSPTYGSPLNQSPATQSPATQSPAYNSPAAQSPATAGKSSGPKPY